MRPEDRPLLGIYWRQQYDYDLVLPFGLRSAPFIFNQVADAFEWICHEDFGISDLIHLLDDFLTTGPPASGICCRRLEIILAACTYLGIPLAEEKTEASTTSLTFLGIHLDTDLLEARLPDDKLAELRDLLVMFSGLPLRTKRDLLSLLGKLNFATSVVMAGRTFMRRLWDATLAVPELHYRITLSQSCRADLVWWRYLLDTWNGRSFFLQPGWSPAPHMHLFTDASGTLGYGTFLGDRWFSGTWLPDQQACCITYKELYPIALACSTWGHEWSSLRVEFHSDNQAVVSSLRKGSCCCSNILSLHAAPFVSGVCSAKFQVSASYVEGVVNGIADFLSRQDFGRFRTLAPQAAAIPDTTRPLPSNLGEPSLVPCTSTHSNR